MPRLTLISFPTCPYVQRAVIALKEKEIPFDVVYIDLADKPDWFLAISPLGKVPVLKVAREGEEPGIVFESAVILEYLEEAVPGRKLHPEDPLERALHRSWIEFGSQLLGDLFRLGMARTAAEFEPTRRALLDKLARLETVVAGPFFAGERFSAVDAVFAPAFRQIDVLDALADTGLTAGLPRLNAWRRALADRPSVREAVPPDYAERYLTRLRAGEAHILKVLA